MAKNSAQAYCIIDFPHSMVFPAEVAMELFPAICQGEAVEYDWTTKQHRRKPSRDGVCIKQFTLAQVAELELNSET